MIFSPKVLHDVPSQKIGCSKKIDAGKEVRGQRSMTFICEIGFLAISQVRNIQSG